MNRQVDYIIHAGILLSLMSGLLYFINAVSENNNTGRNETPVYINTPAENIQLTDAAAKGKAIYMGKCASCHSIWKDMTGPALAGFTERGPWTDRKNVYAWIRNPQQFMQSNEYAQELKTKYNAIMTGFPDLTNEEIDAICEYVGQVKQRQTDVVAQQ